MRVMLRMQMPADSANASMKNGRFGKIFAEMTERVKPEAAYFVATDGDRTGFVFFDLKDPSDIPAICEPLFIELGAKIDITPAMTADDVLNGFAKMVVG